MFKNNLDVDIEILVHALGMLRIDRLLVFNIINYRYINNTSVGGVYSYNTIISGGASSPPPPPIKMGKGVSLSLINEKYIFHLLM